MKYKCQLIIVCPQCHQVNPNAKYGSVKSHLGVCRESINGTAEIVQTLQTDLNNATTKVNANETKITNIEARVSNLETKINELETIVTNNSTSINHINSEIETIIQRLTALENKEQA